MVGSLDYKYELLNADLFPVHECGCIKQFISCLNQLGTQVPIIENIFASMSMPFNLCCGSGTGFAVSKKMRILTEINF
jgi:hypothetical protein